MSSAEESKLLARLTWQCAICMDTQPLASIGESDRAWARSAAKAAAYLKSCAASKTAPEPILALEAPKIDSTRIRAQRCRTCAASGLIVGGSGDVGDGDDAKLVNLPVIRTIVGQQLQEHGPGMALPRVPAASAAEMRPEAVGSAWLQMHGLDDAAALAALLRGDEAHVVSAASAPLSLAAAVSAPLVRTACAAPVFGLRPRPRVGISFDPRMTLHERRVVYHDYPAIAAAASSSTPTSDGASSAAALVPAAAAPAPASATAGAAAEPTLMDAVTASKPRPMPDTPAERPDRVRAAAGYLAAVGLLQECVRIETREATPEEISLAVTPEQAARINALVARSEHEATPAGGGAIYQLDTYWCPHTGLAARLALGSTAEAIYAAAAGVVQRALCLVRPPGHHACATASTGFCVYSNVAAAVKGALARDPSLQRVLVVDWDIHHGNGTEAMLWDDPRVLTVSLHRYDGGSFYPNSGSPLRIGGPAAKGYSVNVGLDGPWYGDADYAAITDAVLCPLARSFAPQLVVVSCGFDAARGDPLGDFDVTPAGYAYMTHALIGAAAAGNANPATVPGAGAAGLSSAASVGGGAGAASGPAASSAAPAARTSSASPRAGWCVPLVVVMEGGYNLKSIAASSEAILRVLLGEAPAPLAAWDGTFNRTAAVEMAAEGAAGADRWNFWPAVMDGPGAAEAAAEAEQCSVATAPDFAMLRQRIAEEEAEAARLKAAAGGAGVPAVAGGETGAAAAGAAGAAAVPSARASDVAGAGHGPPGTARRVPRPGTWRAIRRTLEAHAPYWPAFAAQLEAMRSASP